MTDLKSLLIAILGLALGVALLHEQLWAFALWAGALLLAHQGATLTVMATGVLGLLVLAIGSQARAASAQIGGGLADWFARHGYVSYLLLALPAAGLAVYWTFSSYVWAGLSGFAAAAANICLFILAYALFDRLPFQSVDTYAEIRRGNLAVSLYCSAIALGMALLIMAATS